VEVSYTTTLDDYVAFNLHTLKHSSSMKWRFRLGWALVPLGCLIAVILLASKKPGLALALAAGGVVYAIVYPLLYPGWAARTVGAYARDLGARGVIGRMTLILTDDSLTERTDTVESVARWQDMKGVDVLADCTYIYITGLSAAIIPRHGFERVEEYEAVRDFAVAKLGTTA
jgi:hypothetical protein